MNETDGTKDVETDWIIFDKSKNNLTSVPKPLISEHGISVDELRLDYNELKNLKTINNYQNIRKLSCSFNLLDTINDISTLIGLVKLDVSHNNLSVIEGLSELVHLKYLDLSFNNIQSFDCLNANILLEYIDLSANRITKLGCISEITNLKNLLLRSNKISNLQFAKNYLPKSIVKLSLSENKIQDLAEISRLTHLVELSDILIEKNPCVQVKNDSFEQGLDYRPYVLNWLDSLKSIDSIVVDDIERLKAEWLYSHGEGRRFAPGQHKELIKYLTKTFPFSVDESSPIFNQSAQDKKLRLILSKAHLHQKQLLSDSSNPRSIGSTTDLMTRSLDSISLCSNSSAKKNYENLPIKKPFSLTKTDISTVHHVRESNLTRSLHCDFIHEPEKVNNTNVDLSQINNVAPLPTATKLVPVPESLVSPMVSTPPIIPTISKINFKDKMSSEKLQTIKHRAEQKRHKQFDKKNKDWAATCIQKYWRGYYERKKNPKILSLYYKLSVRRTEEYIYKISKDMEFTRQVLHNEHKLQILQMQAITALWKKINQLHPDSTSVGDLAKVCDRLDKQVQRLQVCMDEVLRCVSLVQSNTSEGTQTVAVSPLDGNKFQRPSSLLIDSNNKSQGIEKNNSTSNIHSSNAEAALSNIMDSSAAIETAVTDPTEITTKTSNTPSVIDFVPQYMNGISCDLAASLPSESITHNATV